MKIYKYTLFALHFFLTAAGLYYLGTQRPEGGAGVLLGMLLVLFWALGLGYYLYFRRRFIGFSEEICRKAEQIAAGGGEKGGSLADHNQETLTSKMVMELEKMEDVTRNRLGKSEREKEQLQKTVSEIAHQVKTPLSNIRMYQDMLAEPDVAKEEAGEFMEIIGRQLDKLEFLIDSLVKTSRLESDLIRLKIGSYRLLPTLEAARNEIARKAEKKEIELSLCCDSHIRAYHDVKWTAEAVGNILDNAVKYTPEWGRIRIEVIPGELYVQIRISDTGKGIRPEHYNDIFKRFYREDEARSEEGLGLGLYIARNILMREEGYIMVRSKPGEGSSFSIFLPMDLRV